MRADDIEKEARHLIRGTDMAALATGLADGSGWPYASLVLVAFAHDGSPVLLLSDLAEHTKGIAADSRVSLLFDGTAGHQDRLTGPRVTLLGRARATDEPEHASRFLARHPGAVGYVGFDDFRFYSVSVEKAHVVAGFGRISWIGRDAVCGSAGPASPLALAEKDIVAHMNEDHSDTLDLYAGILLGLPGTGWRMTGIDEEGCDLRLEGNVARVPFDNPVRSAEEARTELIRLVGAARTAPAR